MVSYEIAKRFFHKYSIPRRVRDIEAENLLVESGKNHRMIWRQAHLHEKNSEMYPIFKATTDDLGPFGIGIALYFKQLQWLSLAFFLYGCVSIYNLVYYSMNFDKGASGLNFLNLLPGSAYCVDYVQVTATSNCPNSATTCDATYATACELDIKLGIFDLFGIFLLFVYCISIGWYQEKQQRIVDESIQTSQDYAITVLDPGPNDDDPKEWQEFFSQFGEVSYITIARGNSKLLKALARRRDIRAYLSLLTTHGPESTRFVPNPYTDGPKVSENLESAPYPDFYNEKAPLLTVKLNVDSESDDSEEEDLNKKGIFFKLARKVGLVRTIDDWGEELRNVNKEIALLEKERYPVVRIYCVFDSEKAKQNCLKRLATGQVQAFMNMREGLPKNYLFRGENVLRVVESNEPSEIIWENLELGFKFCLIQDLISLAISFVIIYLSYLAIYYAITDEDSSSWRLLVVVTSINYILPYLCYIVTSLERQYNKGNVQNSLMTKLVAARFMNTTLISYITISSNETLSYSQLAAIQALMISDAFITPTLAALDISNNFYRMVLSRLSTTQRMMNTYFLGSPWDLAERYTSMLKTVLVALFYACLYPMGLFFAAFCFIYTYVVDRYMLMRLWTKAPAYDARLAKKALTIILLCLLAHLYIASTWYSEWPFDSSIKKEDGSFVYYNKLGMVSNVFEFVKIDQPDWMSSDQYHLTLIFVYFTLVLSVCLGIYYFFYGAYYSVLSLFFGYQPILSSDQKIPFSCVSKIQAYVPMCSPCCALVGNLVACHSIALSEEHYPSLRTYKTESLQQAFNRLNVANEFPASKRKSLFGIVQGFKK